MTGRDLSRAAAQAALCLLALLAAAGDARAFEVCGDGVCNTEGCPPESSETCPEDCGGSPCQGDVCETCAPPQPGDRDLDGIPDTLEFELAHAFFPHILMQWEDIDRDESYLFQGFSIPYAMQPVHDGTGTLCDELWECLEIRYGIAFFFDHGDVWDIGEHLGDSEVYAAVLRRDGTWIDTQGKPDQWRMIRDFTSAHWGSGTWDSSRVGVYGCPTCSDLSSNPAACSATQGCSYSGYCNGLNFCNGLGQQSCQSFPGACTWHGSCANTQACDDPLPQEGPVEIFSAESKHALYHTKDECDEGANWFDDCPNNDIDMREFKEGLLQNVGNLFNHVNFDTTIQHPNRCHLYPVWGGGPFGGGSSYKKHFSTPIDWQLH